MAQYIGFGNGSDGAVTLSGTEAPIDSSCSGTSGATSLSATNASFSAGQIILIHQSRGTGAGQWEINQISSYVAGTITTSIPLSYTYTDSGASQAQVRVLKQYTDVTISGTFTGKAWNGDVGGIVAFLATGTVNISGTLNAAGLTTANNTTTGGQGIGFRGGNANTSLNVEAKQSYCGEGTTGDLALQTTANGNGGGGGFNPAPSDTSYGGGGGGHSASGTAGSAQGSGGTVGAAGGTAGSSDLVTMVFGGGGGGSATNGNGGRTGGGGGGGIVIIMCNVITITGSITVNGGGGGTGDWGAGGGGAGGSVYIKARTGTLGTNLITALGGAGGVATNNTGDGGAGANGIIRVELCSGTGTTNPSASEQKGGFSFCTVKHGIL